MEIEVPLIIDFAFKFKASNLSLIKIVRFIIMLNFFNFIINFLC